MFAKRYAKYYDLLNSKKPYKKEIKFVFDWANKPKSIIDIGCGTASYWKHFPEHVNLWGIDQSCAMIVNSEHKQRIVCSDIGRDKFPKFKIDFDAATALFQVMNYIPKHDWWSKIPILSGGFFVFDVWDTEKIKHDGFVTTTRCVNGVTRIIEPIFNSGKEVMLQVICEEESGVRFVENHPLYLYSEEEIKEFCSDQFEIVETKNTKTWQKWFKLRKK